MTRTLVEFALRVSRTLFAACAVIGVTALGSTSAVAACKSPAANIAAVAPVAPVAAKDAATGRYGYRDASGAWAVAPTFASAGDFAGGLAFIENPDRSSGLINVSGAMVTPNVQAALWESAPTITEAHPSEGLLAARDNESGKVGFVDARGCWVIKPRFADAFEFHEGLAAFRKTEGGKVGFVDARGRIAITARFGTNFRVPPVFSEKLAAVGENDDWPRTNLDPPGKLGYIDKRGRWAIPPKYASGSPFVGGSAKVTLGSREIGIKNPLRR